MQNLELITLAHIPLLAEYLKRYPRENCDYSITNILAWGKIYKNHLLLWQDNLVVFNPKYQYICFPMGHNFSEADLADLVRLFRPEYPEAELILIPEEYIAQHPKLSEFFTLTDDRSWADYVYDVDKLVKLSGKRLAKKKNLVSQFVRAYPEYKVLPITSDKADVLLSFTHKWRRERSADGIYLMTEIKAIEHTLEMWDSLPTEGIIICLHHRIAAFSVYSPQTENMVSEHFEKFDPDKKGSAQLINWETMRSIQGRYKYVNREQDLGLEGLRQAKMSYEPDYMVKFFLGTLKNA
ncbi:MAG: phosphatidylglycerol lysyltransferase domain-containing protein [Candidatus Cloacimonas sp.]|jgi:hypothetical protein|nr:phosphatidylglycerol lysyltransferase domain-containing protein [Candidatus Cloacimonas sp.]